MYLESDNCCKEIHILNVYSLNHLSKTILTLFEKIEVGKFIS